MPGFYRLTRVRRPDDQQVRDGAQGGQVLHRLVGRAILTQPDAVVSEHIDYWQAHHRRQADSGAHIVRKHQECSPVGAQPVQGQAVEHRTHAVFPHSKVQVTPGEIVRPHHFGAFR